MDTIYTLLKFYENKRAEHYALVNPGQKSGIREIFRSKSEPSESELFDREFALQQNLSSDQQLLNALQFLRKDQATWNNSVLLLKNRSEQLSSRIDYLNYLHTFLAFFLAIVIVMSNWLGPQNWIMMILVGIVICMVFKDRAELRIKLLRIKEFANFIESNKDKLEELDTSTKELDQTSSQ